MRGVLQRQMPYTCLEYLSTVVVRSSGHGGSTIQHSHDGKLCTKAKKCILETAEDHSETRRNAGASALNHEKAAKCWVARGKVYGSEARFSLPHVNLHIAEPLTSTGSWKITNRTVSTARERRNVIGAFEQYVISAS